MFKLALSEWRHVPQRQLSDGVLHLHLCQRLYGRQLRIRFNSNINVKNKERLGSREEEGGRREEGGGRREEGGGRREEGGGRREEGGGRREEGGDLANVPE
jgi:hypothetical protein